MTQPKGPKERIKAWFAEHEHGLQKAYGVPLGTVPLPEDLVITGLSSYAEPMLQVEYRARAAFWPRSMFEQDWPSAERELERFFLRCALKERTDREKMNGARE